MGGALSKRRAAIYVPVYIEKKQEPPKPKRAWWQRIIDWFMGLVGKVKRLF